MLHVPAAFSYQVRQSPAPVGGQTAGGRQPGTDSSHWTELGPGGWRVVPGMGTAIKHSITTMSSTFSKHYVIQMDCKDPMCTYDSVKNDFVFIWSQHSYILLLGIQISPSLIPLWAHMEQYPCNRILLSSLMWALLPQRNFFFKDLEPVQGHFFREGSFVFLKQLQKEFDILQSNFVWHLQVLSRNISYLQSPGMDRRTSETQPLQKEVESIFYRTIRAAASPS